MAPLQGDDPAVGCRGCWQAQPMDAHRLNCGDVFCAACLAALARAALQAPAQLLPLRCCQQSVSAERIVAVLSPAEAALYQFLTAQEADAKRTRVALGNETLVAQCDVCETTLAVAATEQELLLDCGHIYCRACLASMRSSSCSTAKRRQAVVCCLALANATDCKKKGKAVAVNGSLKTRSKAPVASLARRASPRLQGQLTDDGRGDQQQHDAQPTQATQKPTPCMTCRVAMDAATARVASSCGHVFCFACVKQRCQRALTNEAEGSIGVPLHCCQTLLALDVIQPALTKREFLKYEALVAKRSDDAPRLQSKGKRKADAVEMDVEAVQPEKKRPRGRPVKALAKAKTQHALVVAVGKEQDPGVVKKRECVACMSPVEQSLCGPCGHVYCVACLGLMATTSLKDRTHVPIRCCGQEFPIEYVKRVLSEANVAQYERFVQEKNWRESDLKSDVEYARVVKKLRGKQCPTCGIGVQKVGGCDAMRCLHGHHFCWKCVAAPCTCGSTQLANYGFVAPPVAAAASVQQ